MQERRPKDSARWLQQYFGTPAFNNAPIVRPAAAPEPKNSGLDPASLPPMPAPRPELVANSV